MNYEITYNYINKMLLESGIDFNNISLEDMINTCKSYAGKIDKNNLKIVLDVINNFYKN